jgi:hypothetical protein
MPAMKTYREAIFSGWFGPMGVGAVFLSIIAKEELELAYEGKEAPVSIQIISPVVLFIVFCSVIVHGTTIPLFKLGKRIRTRTLSITSISSNQVLRLPKLQFGQQLHKKEDHNDKEEMTKGRMTELERNTLFNTLQHDTSNSGNTISIDMMIKHESSLSDSEDLLEEDFLPDDENVSINKLKPLSAEEETAVEDPRRASAVSLDTQQAIRFLEPVKPRMTNVERNETSASSLKSWLLGAHSHHHHHAHHNKEEMLPSPVPPLDAGEDQHQHHHGIKQFIKRLAHHNEHSNPNTPIEGGENDLKKMFACSPSSITQSRSEQHLTINPRIEVWEEKNHVVVEDAQGDQVVVIDKADYPTDWKKATVEKIKQVENDLNHSNGGPS